SRTAQGGSGGILANTPHPFGATKTFRLGDPLELKGRCVVFSNELFDAQPFHRFVFRRGAWRELGVALRDDTLVEVELPEASPALSAIEGPAPSPVEGYCIDTPLEATALAGRIAAQPWSGLFLAFDYGKTWAELTEATPAGTARAYFRHAQSNDLLARPGEQDLTCHVCWDWLADALARHGFATPQVESQESFFVHHAADYLAGATAAEAGRFSEKKLSLLQLLHPSHLGQKFQALWAWRD
ncbi:MAG TPA: SAM-dependent methyltransferase, partial [Opitutaceae bacterium]|nr:SAM-dependent methyltransferase [Opitutaceae bacterium]